MARIMYDSVNWRAIPESAEMVAGYLAPSPFAWPQAAWDRFPNAVKVRIAVRSFTNAGHVLDVEKGDATPTQSVDWVRMRRAAGADPSVYCSTSAWSAVMAEFRSAGEAYPHWWVAHYDGIRLIPMGAVAKQFADPNAGSGGDWDLSIVADYWPGVDQGGIVAAVTEETGSYIDLVRRVGLMEKFLNADEAAGDMVTLLRDAVGRIEALIKGINQTYGSAAGNGTVNQLAKTIAAIKAKADLIAPVVPVTISDDQMEQFATMVATNVIAQLPPGGATKEEVHQAVVDVVGSVVLTVNK